jgi:uncharacterized cupin superfamily protein
MSDEATVVNTDEAEELALIKGRWGHAYKILTPDLRETGHGLGVNHTRLPPGCASGPFHFHMREDEVFYVLSGRGILRYGEHLREISAGDCISCPAGTKVAHQIANPFDQDLCYLAIGLHDPDEVCGYPDSGKTFARGLGQIGYFSSTKYMDGEPETPTIFDLIEAQK